MTSKDKLMCVIAILGSVLIINSVIVINISDYKFEELKTMKDIELIKMQRVEELNKTAEKLDQNIEELKILENKIIELMGGNE